MFMESITYYFITLVQFGALTYSDTNKFLALLSMIIDILTRESVEFILWIIKLDSVIFIFIV